MFSLFKPTIESLPDDIKNLIFSYLSPHEKLNIYSICKNWKEVLDKGTFKKEIKYLLTLSTWISFGPQICAYAKEAARYSQNHFVICCVLDFTGNKKSIAEAIMPNPAYGIPTENFPHRYFRQMDCHRSYTYTSWLKLTEINKNQIDELFNGTGINHTIFLACIDTISDIVRYHEIAKQKKYFVLFVTTNHELSLKIKNSILYEPIAKENLFEFFYKNVLDKLIELSDLVKNKNDFENKNLSIRSQCAIV